MAPAKVLHLKLLITLAAAAISLPASANITVQQNVAFTAKKLDSYSDGPAFELTAPPYSFYSKPLDFSSKPLIDGAGGPKNLTFRGGIYCAAYGATAIRMIRLSNPLC